MKEILTHNLIQSENEDTLKTFFGRNSRPEVTDLFTAFPLSGKEAERIAHHTGKDKYFLLSMNDTPVGFWMLRGWDEGFSVPSLGLFVDFEHQGKGFGRSIVREASRICKDLGCGAIRLSVYPQNKGAIGLYLSEGYIPQESKDPHKIIMIRRLSETAEP